MEIKIDECFLTIEKNEELNVIGGGKLAVAKKVFKTILEYLDKAATWVGRVDVIAGIGGAVSGAKWKSQDQIICEDPRAAEEMGRYHCYNMCPIHR